MKNTCSCCARHQQLQQRPLKPAARWSPPPSLVLLRDGLLCCRRTCSHHAAFGEGGASGGPAGWLPFSPAAKSTAGTGGGECWRRKTHTRQAASRQTFSISMSSSIHSSTYLNMLLTPVCKAPPVAAPGPAPRRDQVRATKGSARARGQVRQADGFQPRHGGLTQIALGSPLSSFLQQHPLFLGRAGRQPCHPSARDPQ